MFVDFYKKSKLFFSRILNTHTSNQIFLKNNRLKDGRVF